MILESESQTKRTIPATSMSQIRYLGVVHTNLNSGGMTHALNLSLPLSTDSDENPKILTLSGMWIIIAIIFYMAEVSNENRTNDP